MNYEIARSSIKSIDIKAAFDKVYDFLAEPLNWPQYAVVNLRSVERGEKGWYKTVTRFGEGHLKIDPVKEWGILDHTWKDPQASWAVPTRVVANGKGATVMMTIYKPTFMSDAQFDQAMKEMDIEMNKLKEILEQKAK